MFYLIDWSAVTGEKEELRWLVTEGYQTNTTIFKYI